MNPKDKENILEFMDSLNWISGDIGVNVAEVRNFINALSEEEEADANRIIGIINKWTHDILNDVVLRIAMEIVYGEDEFSQSQYPCPECGEEMEEILVLNTSIEPKFRNNNVEWYCHNCGKEEEDQTKMDLE